MTIKSNEGKTTINIRLHSPLRIHSPSFRVCYTIDHGRARVWVPGVSSPGHPNDYINMFLEESKQWMRSQMTLDAVHAEELARRDNFYTKLKNDNYFWCVC